MKLSKVVNNRAALEDLSSQGGGIFIDTQKVLELDVVIEESEVSYNFATIKGGAIFIRPF